MLRNLELSLCSFVVCRMIYKQVELEKGESRVDCPEQWTVKRLAASLGAEIGNAELGKLEESGAARIKELLLEHKVLFFPAQTISLEEHVMLGEHFGVIESHPNLKNPFIEHDKVFELAASKGGIADEWHTDLTFMEEPSIMSVLHMVTCPEVGGDTMWTNLCQAYEELSEPIKDLCASVQALHDALPHNRSESMAVHPVVRIHPKTGEKALYVNEHFTRRIVEMNSTESEVFLGYLTKWVQSPRFTVRYSWTPGTIAIWDNQCTQHFVLNDFEGERIIHRVTIMGDQPEGVGPVKYQPWIRTGNKSDTSRLDRQLKSFYRGQQ